ncbi:MAG: T9SS type A sorting domain-containing protein [Flavobacteriales bacterium]|nr:T9SS type A sorting domain-containing protein [Flavobacteriales bacterium]
MKKVYLMALAALFGTASMAQVSVTFQVDMNGETVSPNGVHVAGSWQEEAGFSADWQPGESTMSDDDMDGIYQLTVNIPAGEYEYKFINDNDWPGVESVPAISQKEGGLGNDNRAFSVSDWHGDAANLPDGYVLPAVTFSGSAPAGEVAVRLQVDMGDLDIDELGVHVAGNFSNPNWTPQLSKAFSAQGNVYAFVANVAADATYQFKFLNGDFWGMDEQIPGGCATDGNRTITVTSEDGVYDPLCYGTCDVCSEPVQLTFRVNMSLQEVSENGVHVAGNWQAAAGFSANWQPGESMMTDIGSGIYELVVNVPPGDYEYKFVNGNDWGFDESVPGDCATNGNRGVTVVEGGDNIENNCFAQCSGGTTDCLVDPDPAPITFLVNMNEVEEISPEGVWIIGGFTDPAWQGGATQMTDGNGDGVFEATLNVQGPASIQFKFVNGDVNVPANEESFDFETAGCGQSNGIGGFNRNHVRSGEPETLGFTFNSCATLPLSAQDLELGEVAIFPNPSSDMAFLNVENPNGHTLRMNLIDVAGKVVTENMVITSTRTEINTNDLPAGLYFLDIINERNERGVYKLMVK